MSNFTCEYCKTNITKNANGQYVTGCEHYPFEEWYGNYDDGSFGTNHNRFVIFDSDGEGVVSDADALEAWQEFREKNK